MKKRWTGVLMVAALLLGRASMTSAIPIVSVDMDPGTAGIQSTFTLDLGNTLTVDLVIKDVVAPGLNAFELDLMFDPTILDPTSVVSGGFLLAPSFVVQATLGVLDVMFAEVTLLPAGAIGGGVIPPFVVAIRSGARPPWPTSV